MGTRKIENCKMKNAKLLETVLEILQFAIFNLHFSILLYW